MFALGHALAGVSTGTKSRLFVGLVVGCLATQVSMGQGTGQHPASRVRVSEGVSQGRLIKKVDPVYPDGARQRCLQGPVRLNATIDKSGNVSNISVAEGAPVLAASAVEAVQQWKYEPYLMGGKTVEVATTIKVNFTMSSCPASSATAQSDEQGSLAQNQRNGTRLQRVAGREGADVVDVRYVAGETRMLEDDEYSALRAGLHYVPESVQLSKGGGAVSRLVDSNGRVLAAYMVQWIKTFRPVVGTKMVAGGKTVNRYGPPVGYFHVVMKNLSTCQWSPSANLNDPTDAFDAANSILRGPSASVYSPNPGQTAEVNTRANLNDNYSMLILAPKDPELSLTQCRTKGLQQQPKIAWQNVNVEWMYTSKLTGHRRGRKQQNVTFNTGSLVVDAETSYYIQEQGDSPSEHTIEHDTVLLGNLACDQAGVGKYRLADPEAAPWVVYIPTVNHQLVVQTHVTGERYGQPAPAGDAAGLSIDLLFADEATANAAKNDICKAVRRN